MNPELKVKIKLKRLLISQRCFPGKKKIKIVYFGKTEPKTLNQKLLVQWNLNTNPESYYFSIKLMKQ